MAGKSKRGGLKMELWRTPVLSWGRGGESGEEVEEGWSGGLWGARPEGKEVGVEGEVDRVRCSRAAPKRRTGRRPWVYQLGDNW